MSDENRSDQILGVAILFLTLTWISTSLRVYVRANLLGNFGVDDTIMVATLLFYTAYLICQFGSIAHGNGQLRKYLTDETAQIGLKYWFFCELFYTIATCMLKIAVGFFLLRIANNRLHIVIMKIIMVTSGLVGIVYCSIVLFQCKPISYWWDLNPDHHGKCLSALAVVYATYVASGLNAFADWVFAILPIFIVKDLQMKGHTKVVVAFILGLAAVGSAATIIRIPYIWTIKEYKGEFLHRSVPVAVWTTIEVGIGITAGNIATLRPLMQKSLALFGVTSSTAGITSKYTKNKFTGTGGYRPTDSTPLDDFGKGNAKTTITIRGGNVTPHDDMRWAGLSRSDSQDDIVSGAEGKAFDSILRSVEINTYEERANSSVRTHDTDEEKGLSPPRPFERL